MTGWDPEAYLAERHPGVRVVDYDLAAGLQGCISHPRQIIWLASWLSPVQRRCALAYEIGHLEFGPTPKDPCLAAAHRRAADEWAALMLIPTDMFVAAWEGCLGMGEMADRCGVDVRTFRTRIRAASDADQDACMEAIGRTRLSAF